MAFPSFDGARESRNLLHGAHAFSIWADGAFRFGTRRPVSFGLRKRDCERLEAECGVTAAEEMQAMAHKTISQVQADLVDKARYTAAHWPGEWDDEVMVSIVDDLL